jgi:3D-(3,5/4)-trihydroxycyclohexane-1,2-dione acylhydrolase (decyclizing)
LGWRSTRSVSASIQAWNAASEAVMAAPPDNAALQAAQASQAAQALPSDAQVIGAIWRHADETAVMVCAAGGLPGELHKNWRTRRPGGYHVEYGFSCMGYEIAAGLGVKMAEPDRDVIVMVGDGSYMMANSEIASAVAMGLDLTIVVLNNRGFGCINRLQQACGGAPFNNLWADTRHVVMPNIDFTRHAASMGATARKISGIAELEAALDQRTHGVTVLVIDTDPMVVTEAGGAWWDVAVPEVSERPAVRAAHETYLQRLQRRLLGDA